MNFGATERRPWIVVVGGFLGAGKTSLILAATEVLEERGLRSAVVLNDHGRELVDTRHAGMRGADSREVTGGCFCCRFSELASVIEELHAYGPDVIFAEPVGSCTDISATVLGPLREEFDRYRLAPFTVLVDPAQAATLLRDDADANLVFLWRKQLQEADLVCMSKADIYSDATGIPDIEARQLSARTGQGVRAWLDEILAGSLGAGTKTLEIDYEVYARAEAALAWLNLSVTLEAVYPATPAAVVGPLVDHLDGAFTTAGISIVHLKLIDSTATGWLKAAICANGQEPTVEGMLDASPAKRHELLLNLRAIGEPDHAREIMENELKHFAGSAHQVRLECFSPSPPKPERRVLRTA
jgi:hypothetical protein